MKFKQIISCENQLLALTFTNELVKLVPEYKQGEYVQEKVISGPTCDYKVGGYHKSIFIGYKVEKIKIIEE